MRGSTIVVSTLCLLMFAEEVHAAGDNDGGAAAAESLKEQAVKLTQLVGMFKLHAEAAGVAEAASA